MDPFKSSTTSRRHSTAEGIHVLMQHTAPRSEVLSGLGRGGTAAALPARTSTPTAPCHTVHPQYSQFAVAYAACLCAASTVRYVHPSLSSSQQAAYCEGLTPHCGTAGYLNHCGAQPHSSPIHPTRIFRLQLHGD